GRQTEQFSRGWLEPMNPQPQFLRIRWEDTTEQGAIVTLEAMACLRHRQEIALAYASTRGARGLGEACDLCEGRNPRPLGSELPHSVQQSARVPLTAAWHTRPLMAPAEHRSGIDALLQGARGDCGT